MAVTSTSDPGEFLQSPNDSSDSPAFSLQSTVSLLCCTKTGLMLKDFCIGFELGSFEKPAGARQELRTPGALAPKEHPYESGGEHKKWHSLAPTTHRVPVAPGGLPWLPSLLYYVSFSCLLFRCCSFNLQLSHKNNCSLYILAVPNFFGTKDWCSYENIMLDDLKWS